MSGSYRDIYLGELANIGNQISPTSAQDNLWGNVVTGGESGYNPGSPHGNIYTQMPNNYTGQTPTIGFFFRNSANNTT